MIQVLELRIPVFISLEPSHPGTLSTCRSKNSINPKDMKPFIENFPVSGYYTNMSKIDEAVSLFRKGFN
jgi:hypothetical protein